FPIVRPTAFVHADLAQFLSAHRGRFKHIDAYGVLHHMPNPRAALIALADALAPGGTARVMVYNTRARAWIRELQRVAALLGLNPSPARALSMWRTLLGTAGRALPALGQRLAQLGPATLANDARLVDTFLHAREARLGITAWLDAVREA